MIEQETITHHIQRYIIGYLLTHEFTRFRDMRPLKTDTNLYSYHLKLLQKNGMITKTDRGYTLSQKGLHYVDTLSESGMRPRRQPKIITMLLIQEGYGKVLLMRRHKQPYINTWTLPYGKLHMDDASIIEAARRESVEKLGYEPRSLRHVGDCYIRVAEEGELLTVTLAHIVRFETDAIAVSDDLQWVEPLALSGLKLAPAVEQIVTRAFFNDEFFFDEFSSSSLVSDTLPS